MTSIQERKKCNRCKVNLLIKEFKPKRDGTFTKRCIECLDKECILSNIEARGGGIGYAITSFKFSSDSYIIRIVTKEKEVDLISSFEISFK